MLCLMPPSTATTSGGWRPENQRLRRTHALDHCARRTGASFRRRRASSCGIDASTTITRWVPSSRIMRVSIQVNRSPGAGVCPFTLLLPGVLFLFGKLLRRVIIVRARSYRHELDTVSSSSSIMPASCRSADRSSRPSVASEGSEGNLLVADHRIIEHDHAKCLPVAPKP